MIGYTWAQAGDSTKARALLEEWRSWPAQRYVPPLNVAMVHLGLEERDECFAWLEKAYEDQDVRLCLLRVDRRWDAVRSDPRFQSILKRMRLD